MKRDVLPGARPQGVISGHYTLDHNRSSLRPVTLPDKIFTCGKLPDSIAQAAERSDIGSIDGAVSFEIPNTTSLGAIRSDLACSKPVNVSGRAWVLY
jgi:hypothetical protein